MLGKSVIILVFLVTLPVIFDSAVECYDGGHAVADSAVPRHSSMGTRSSPATVPPAGEQTSRQHHRSQKHRVH
jgi:hypothetical protein